MYTQERAQVPPLEATVVKHCSDPVPLLPGGQRQQRTVWPEPVFLMGTV